MALMDTAIRRAKPGTKPFKLYDREGLFLLVNPSASKLWRWRYKFDGKEKLMALGEYPNSNDAPVLEDALKDHSTIIWFPLCWQACLVGAVDRFDEGTAEAPPSLISHVRGMFRRPSKGYVISPCKIESF